MGIYRLVNRNQHMKKKDCENVNHDKKRTAKEIQRELNIKALPGSLLEKVLNSIASDDYGDKLRKAFETPPGEKGIQKLIKYKMNSDCNKN